MANITRFDPFLDVDDLLRGFRLMPMRRSEDAPKMKLEVQEDDKSYTMPPASFSLFSQHTTQQSTSQRTPRDQPKAKFS